MPDKKQSRKELWDQLANEGPRQYAAFKAFLYLDPRERTLLKTWREYSGNPEAKAVPGYASDWSKKFAWKDRAIAHDMHMDEIRRRGMERAIEDEAMRGAKDVERTRNRLSELLTMAYDGAITWLEESTPANYRAQDVIQIIKLHADIAREDGAAGAGDAGANAGETWSEEDDDEFVKGVLADINSGRATDGTEETWPDTEGEGS